MVYNIVSIICLVIMAILVIVLLIKYIREDHDGRIRFIKRFKIGKCAIIYIVSIPLFIVMGMYDGKDFIIAFFQAFYKSISLVALKYEFPIEIMKEHTIFTVALFTCYALVLLNAYLLTLSFFGRSIINGIKNFLFKVTNKSKTIVIGKGRATSSVISSCTQKVLLIGLFSKEEKEQLFFNGTVYKAFVDEKKMFKWLLKETLKSAKKAKNNNQKINLIIAYDEEDKKLSLCNEILANVSKFKDEEIAVTDFYVFGDREFEDIYCSIEEQSRGLIHYINLSQKVAVDFINQYPLTEYMDKEQINYDKCALRNDVYMSVSFVGFGYINRDLFISLVSNSQYYDEDNKLKDIKYFIFDKKKSSRDHRYLNHNYYRYRNEFFDKDKKLKVNQDDYLELPPLPSDDQFFDLDINSAEFFANLKNAVTFDKKDYKSGYHYIVVALGSDYLNIDVANKIKDLINEWNIKNVNIFVRIGEIDNSEMAKKLLNDEHIHVFGEYERVVSDFSHIILEKYTNMSIYRNFIYEKEHDVKNIDLLIRDSKINWFTKRNRIERDSNIYACLSIRSKLHLLGLDIVDKDNKIKGLEKEEYLKIYLEGKSLEYKDDKVVYGLDYEPSKRSSLAEMEHYRWNAFMIMNGFTPASLEKIKTEVDINNKLTKGKNYAMRRHGNLTTVFGLVAFRKLIADVNKTSELEEDVIKYDYQLFDYAYDLLSVVNKAIIKKN